jgi:hypothetical protein
VQILNQLMKGASALTGLILVLTTGTVVEAQTLNLRATFAPMSPAVTPLGQQPQDPQPPQGSQPPQTPQQSTQQQACRS